MGKTRVAYPPEFRRQMVELVRAAAASVRGSGRKNGSAGGRTKECHETGGQHDVKPESLIPSSHLSTKPG